MTPLIAWGAVFFTLALIFYSAGIWKDNRRKQLTLWHLTMFALGVVTDSLGTLLMYLHVGHLIFTAHSIAGFSGLALMIFHGLWALKVFKVPHKQQNFHRFSVAVWSFWLVSYFSGLYLGIARL